MDKDIGESVEDAIVHDSRGALAKPTATHDEAETEMNTNADCRLQGFFSEFHD